MPRRAVLTLACLLPLLAAACGEPAAPPLRLASLLDAAPAEPRQVAGPLTAAAEPVSVEVDLEAAQVGRLRVRARGDATLVRLAWRLADEGRFTEFRVLHFPVVPDGGDHVYDVDLRREPYWTGHVAALRLSTASGEEASAGAAAGADTDSDRQPSGSVRITAVEALGRGAAARVTSLRGLTVPSLPGARRLELALPADAPRQARFAAWVGLLPRFDRPGVRARFRAWAEPADGGEAESWVEEEIAGGGGGWHRLLVPVAVPAGGRLVLEAVAEREGEELPAGSAVWGAPMLLPAGRSGGHVAGPTAGPNLLLVVIDTLRADVVGAWGDDGGLTPHLDDLARRSVRFADLTSPSSWTLPSMATLLTGEPPQVHGAGRRVGDFAPTALGDQPPTLAETLAARGFYTAGVYNNIYMNPSFGLEQGFDEYDWVEADDEHVVDRALERLEELADRRHFLLVHLFGPHHPYEPPQDVCWQVAPAFAPGYDGDAGCSWERRDVPTLDGVVPPEKDWRWIEGLYRAEVAASDRQLGRLLAGVRELGLENDTVVVVTADHGEAFFDRLPQLAAAGYVQADHGNTLFRELLHVPALIHAPGLAPAVSPYPAELADLAPTALGLLGVGVPAAAGELPDGGPPGGRDLLAELADGPRGRRTRLADFLLYGPSRWSVRRGPWKLIVPAAPADADSANDVAAVALQAQLFDLDADPGERRDVAALHPDVAADLQALGAAELERRAELRRRLLSGEDDVLNAAYLEWVHITKLRALGYLK